MTADSNTHPPADVLRDFGLGKLPNDASTTILNHLEKCVACRQQVASLFGDSFLQQFRVAQGRSSTPIPEKPVSKLPHQSVAAGQPTIPDSPRELADNQQYEILRELGRGGMGVVYLARNRLMDRLEVLKVMGREFLSQEGARQRFEREIRSAARLNHPNVVAAYNVLPLENLLVLAMEYVEGEDLSRLVKARGPLPVIYACHYARQVALGLQHAYEKQLVHRDIKPQNLMLAREGKKHTVKILDFGLAKANTEKAQQYELTGEGKMLGTPLYIAPEQIDDAATADIRADIYSLGCTLYCLLTGNAPFTDKSLLAILQAHHDREATSLTEIRPEVSEELTAVVRKMMAKSPAERYQTPDDVAQALVPFLKPDRPPAKQQPRPATGSTPGEVWEKLAEPTVTRRPADTTQRRQWLIGAGVLTAVLLLSLAGLWAGGVFKATPKEATPVVEMEKPKTNVVQVEKVIVESHEDRKKAEIQPDPETHDTRTMKDELPTSSEKATQEERSHEVVRDKIEHSSPSPAPNGGGAPASKIEVKELPQGKPVENKPVVLGTVSHAAARGKPQQHLLYSNGHIDSPLSTNIWVLRGRFLIFRWPNRNAPGGVWIDYCKLSADGKSYSGTNQHKTPISGTSVGDGDLSKLLRNPQPSSGK